MSISPAISRPETSDFYIYLYLFLGRKGLGIPKKTLTQITYTKVSPNIDNPRCCRKWKKNLLYQKKHKKRAAAPGLRAAGRLWPWRPCWGADLRRHLRRRHCRAAAGVVAPRALGGLGWRFRVKVGGEPWKKCGKIGRFQMSWSDFNWFFGMKWLKIENFSLNLNVNKWEVPLNKVDFTLNRWVQLILCNWFCAAFVWLVGLVADHRFWPVSPPD